MLLTKFSNDTGCCEAQIIVSTTKINRLTKHFETHPKDKHSRHGLLCIVNSRKKMLTYLKKKDVTRYRSIMTELNLRGN